MNAPASRIPSISFLCFTISGFPRHEFDNIHITFVSNGHHHTTLVKGDIKAMLFEDKLIIKTGDKETKIFHSQEELLRKFSKSSKPQILRVFIPSQLILFQIINGQDWVYGSFEVTEKRLPINQRA